MLHNKLFFGFYRKNVLFLSVMNKKYTYCLFLFALLISLNAAAQIIEATSDSVFANGSASEFELVGGNYIENNTDNELTIVWKRTVNNLPSGWTSSICDKVACWAANIDSKSFSILGNKTEKLDVHFYPNNNPGTAYVEMLAWVQGDSANTVVKSTYKATADVSSNVVSAAKKNYNISIYPNPVKDNMFISGLPENQSFKVEVYSLLGTKVVSYGLSGNTAQGGIHQVEMQELPKGVYMIRIMDKNMNLIFNKSVSKMK